MSLPAELRIRIYAFLVPKPAICIPFSDYEGLIYSCKQIYEEMEAELLKPIPEFFENWANNCVALVTIPQSFREVRNLNVAWPNETKGSVVRSLRGLLYMHLNCLTITSEDIGDNRDQGNVYVLAHLIGKYSHAQKVPCPKRIVFDWPGPPHDEDMARLIGARNALSQKCAWEVYMQQNEQGSSTSVMFERIPRRRGVLGSSLATE